jgi:hypothetical protein
VQSGQEGLALLLQPAALHISHGHDVTHVHVCCQASPAGWEDLLCWRAFTALAPDQGVS